MNLEDLYAAYNLHKASGKSKMELHLFVVADLLAAKREQVKMSGLERDAKQFMRSRR